VSFDYLLFLSLSCAHHRDVLAFYFLVLTFFDVIAERFAMEPSSGWTGVHHMCRSCEAFSSHPSGGIITIIIYKYVLASSGTDCIVNMTQTTARAQGQIKRGAHDSLVRFHCKLAKGAGMYSRLYVQCKKTEERERERERERKPKRSITKTNVTDVCVSNALSSSQQTDTILSICKKPP
jgi:hypothetical protein